MENRKCKYCHTKIPDAVHGNRCYCSESCYWASKRQRQKSQYKAKGNLIKNIRKNEKILKEVFDQYGSSVIDVNIVHSLGMNWLIKTEQLLHNDTVYTCVGEYAYNIFGNKTIQIIQNEGIHST